MADSDSNVAQQLQSRLPVVELVAGYRSGQLSSDVLAGVTLWAVLVPQALAYASLAGVPPVAGLYTSLGAMAMYVVFGTSRELNVGPEATVAILVATIVGPMAGGDVASYLTLTAALAILVGIVSILGGVLKLGWIIRFLSRPVLIGYILGSALIIAESQLSPLLGVDAPTVISAVLALGATNWWTLGVGALTIAVVLGASRLGPRVPAYLIGMVVATIVVVVGDLSERGVAVIGSIPPGLPTLGVPNVPLADLVTLLPSALSVALLMYADSMLTEQSLAKEDDYEVDATQEFFALGAANVGAGLLSGFPVNGSQSRSFVNDAAGAETQVANLVAGILVILTLLFLTPLFESLPRAALAGVLLVAAAGLVDVSALRRVWVLDRFDFWLAIITATLVVVVGVLFGVVVAVFLSLLDAALKPYEPHTAVLARVSGTDRYRDVDSVTDVDDVPGLIIYRFDAPLYFANVDVLADEVRDLVDAADPPAAEVMLSAEAIIDIDSTAHETVHELIDDLHERDIRFTIARAKPSLVETLERSGLKDEIDAFYLEVDSGVSAFRQRMGDGESME